MEITTNRLSGSVLVPDSSERAPARVKLPREFTFWDESESGRVGGRVEFVGDRYRITHLEVEAADGVTHDVLRSIALGQLIVDAVGRTAFELVYEEGDETLLKDSRLTIDEQVFVLFHLARVAGENTNTAIATQLGISTSAAAQRVARLRKKGWLPPARKRGARR